MSKELCDILKQHQKHPERYYGVSQTQMSIARHYGGMNVNGKHYVYNPLKDELIREDVFKAEQKARKAPPEIKGKQVSFFEEE